MEQRAWLRQGWGPEHRVRGQVPDVVRCPCSVQDVLRAERAAGAHWVQRLESPPRAPVCLSQASHPPVAPGTCCSRAPVGPEEEGGCRKGFLQEAVWWNCGLKEEKETGTECVGEQNPTAPLGGGGLGCFRGQSGKGKVPGGGAP